MAHDKEYASQVSRYIALTDTTVSHREKSNRKENKASYLLSHYYKMFAVFHLINSLQTFSYSNPNVRSF